MFKAYRQPVKLQIKKKTSVLVLNHLNLQVYFYKFLVGERYFSTNKGDVSTSRETFEQTGFERKHFSQNRFVRQANSYNQIQTT